MIRKHYVKNKEYLNGYRSRLQGLPFNANQSEDWKMGWTNANQALQFID